jgi:glutathionyl-hydroquinone reductase
MTRKTTAKYLDIVPCVIQIRMPVLWSVFWKTVVHNENKECFFVLNNFSLE